MLLQRRRKSVHAGLASASMPRTLLRSNFVSVLFKFSDLLTVQVNLHQYLLFRAVENMDVFARAYREVLTAALKSKTGAN
jgi:hypothetical protein